MREQHTPGPWTFGTSPSGWSYTIHIGQADNATPTPDYSDVGYIIQTCKGERQSVQEANARLIAAAPDLLHALQGFVEHFKGYDEVDPSTLPLFQFADDIIAKVGGAA